MQRLNKEYKLNNFNDSILLSYGSTNRLNPQVIYISGKSWITPLLDGNYSDELTNSIKCFKKKIRNKLKDSKIFAFKHICNFELSSLQLNKGKNSYMTFDIYLKQKETKSLKELKPYINDFASDILEELTDKLRENAFALSKSKQHL